MILNESRAETRLRHSQMLVFNLRRRITADVERGRLSDRQRVDLEDYLTGVQSAVEGFTRERLDVMNDGRLTAEGKRERAAKIDERETKVLDRLTDDTKRIADKVAEMRRSAIHGLVVSEGGYVARKPTPPDQVHRTFDLLMRQDDRRRRDIYLTACRQGDEWDVVDAVETAPAWAQLVDAPAIEAGQAMRLAESPSAPAIKALESVIQMRNYVVETLRSEMNE